MACALRVLLLLLLRAPGVLARWRAHALAQLQRLAQLAPPVPEAL